MPKHLACALFLAASAAASAQTTSQTIELSNFRFTPNIIQLRAAAPARLHLQNASGGGHSFSAPEFFAAAKMDARSRAFIHSGMIDVPAHGAIDITLVPAAGSYRLKCTHTLHAAFGMKGTIVVN